MEKFSNSLPIFTDDIENPVLQDSLKSLKDLCGNEFKILDWGNNRIAIPVEISVDLPSLGNFENLDIREIEPIILVFDLINYPVSAPRIYTDRLDFPKNNLAHLYIAVNNRPPAFCYVRGNVDEWYANKRIDDLLIRICNWLRDAATGELTENGEQYEPLRLEGYSGIIIYNYDVMLNNLSNGINGTQLAIVLFERINPNTFKFSKRISTNNVSDVFKEIEDERKKVKNDITKKEYFFSYILWNKEDNITAEYQINIPSSWEEFKDFSKFYNIDYEEFEKWIAKFNNINEYPYYPVIIGIHRPKQLIGYSSNIEFVNLGFKITSDDVEDEKIINNISIDILSHNQPLTWRLASQISGRNINLKERSVVFGCGAIGSKIVMHLARSGQTNLTLIDPDKISPHNLVRHVLFRDSEGENKAGALAKRIKEIYSFEQLGVVGAPSFKDGLIDKKETFDNYTWVLDFTASEAFFNKLVMMDSLQNQNVVSVSISDFGNQGIMYREGEFRNPRIDDLQVYLYSLFDDDENIREWLINEQLVSSSNNLLVQVGVGCNSETTVLSDDKISSHASYFSGALIKEMDKPSKKGKIYLNRIIDTQEYRIINQIINVDPFKIYQAVNNPGWTIRFKAEIIEQLEYEFSSALENETGGVFMGVCNYKTKTIHIGKLIDAPIDSKAGPTQFIRGYSGLEEKISDVERKSGGQIGYIGEWHTHPKGPSFPSEQDLISVKRHKEECAKIQPSLPVFLSIITSDGLYPYIF